MGARSAPLPRIRFAVGESHEGEVKRMTAKADPTPARRDQEHDPMTGQDAELDLFRNGVNCVILLERLPPPWCLDRKESTRRALKYRRGAGEVVIVNHDGRGWWDPLSQAKGDIFDLVQFLDPGVNFGRVRQVLRPFVGIVPTFPETLRANKQVAPDLPLAERWNARPRLRTGSPAWRYLAEERGLPPTILLLAKAADIVREGPYGSGWFAHRDEAGCVTHIEIRGPDFKGSVRGGSKTLFRMAGGGQRPMRLAVTEAPIDALSLAALEEERTDTVYVAAGGGMGPDTQQEILRLLTGLAPLAGTMLVSATDANLAGDRYAIHHRELADSAGVAFERLRPTVGEDWNETIKWTRIS